MTRAIQSETSPASIAEFGTQSTAGGWPHTDLLLISDADVALLCSKVVAQQAWDYAGISSIDLDADQDPERMFHLMSVLLSTGIGDAATFGVKYTEPSGNEYDEGVRMIGLSMHIEMMGSQAKLTATLNTARNQEEVD